MTKSRILLVLALLAAGAALAWAFAPRPLEVEVQAVARGRFEESIEEDGRTRLRERYLISAPVAARLARMPWREGDAVHAGEVLAVLTPVMSAMVDDRSLREAGARLKAAEASVAGAAARADRARIAREQARLELRRDEQLANQGFLAPARLDTARLDLEGAERELSAAQAAQEVAGHERAQAAIALQPVSPGQTGTPVSLRAPVDGVVLRMPLQSEATVAPGATLLEIGDPSRLEVVAELLTPDAVRALPGTPVVIERWGGTPLAARVRRVEPSGFTKVSALGIEEQRVNVVIDLQAPLEAWRSLGDGFRVTVRVIVASADGALLVPVGALVPTEEGAMGVYVIDGGRARLRPADLDGRNNTVARVRGGLAAGERVIVYPPPGVADGRRVSARPT